MTRERVGKGAGSGEHSAPASDSPTRAQKGRGIHRSWDLATGGYQRHLLAEEVPRREIYTTLGAAE